MRMKYFKTENFISVIQKKYCMYNIKNVPLMHIFETFKIDE